MKSPWSEAIGDPSQAWSTHPAVDEAIRHLTRLPSGGYAMGPAGAQKISTVIAPLAPTESARAARALAQLAYYLDTEARSPQAAESLLAVVRGAAAKRASARPGIAP